MNRRPHVLWLTPFLPSPPHDGGKKRMHALLLGLARDWRITVLSYINHPLEAFAARDLEAAGVAVRCVPRVPAAAPPELELPGMTYPFYCPDMLEALTPSYGKTRRMPCKSNFSKWPLSGLPRLLPFPFFIPSMMPATSRNGALICPQAGTGSLPSS